MKLTYSPINAAWMFLFGTSLIVLEGESATYATRAEALQAARAKGLKVAANGKVEVAA